MKEFVLRILKPKKAITKELNDRVIRAMAIILIIGFGSSIGGLSYVQLIKGEFFRTKAETQQLGDTTITAERGIIYDTNMSILAKSASAWKVSLNANGFSKIPKKNQEIVLDELEKVLGVSRKTLEKKASYTSYNSVNIKGKIEKEERDELEKFVGTTFKMSEDSDDEVSYNSIVMIDDDIKRYYPYSTLGAQILGFTGTDNTGLMGLEMYYNTTLTGIDGRVISAKSNSSVANEIEYKSVYEAEQGSSLVLTLDETIQRYLDDALADCYVTSNCASCYGIVMDVDTGGILAMSTQSCYDPNDPFTIYNEKAQTRIDTTERTYEDEMNLQWENKAITSFYEPGSVFKVITMAAGLEEDVVEYDEKFNCVGEINVLDTHYFCHNHSGHGVQTLTQGLMNSCNPFFITIGQRLGIDTFYKYFEAFGFTEKTGIDMPYEGTPVKDGTYFSKESMTKVNLASSSFGQSFTVTALQMLNAVNAVANDGKLMQPYVVSKIIDVDGNVVSKTTPKVKRQVISESTSEKILASMEQVSTSGTARNSYIAGYHMAGKTGTSDNLVEKGKYIASFAGCAPSYDPQISIIVVVDDPQGATGGGAVAAPVAAEVIENSLTYLNIERRYSDDEKQLLDELVPNVTGYSINDAKSVISENGLSIKVIGEGDAVISQMPAYDQYIPQGGVVVVYTDDGKKKVKAIVPDFSGMTISQANATAINAGINIKISGNSLSSTNLTAYRQSVDKKKEIECGSTITVYFRTTTGVTDN